MGGMAVGKYLQRRWMTFWWHLARDMTSYNCNCAKHWSAYSIQLHDEIIET